MSGLAAGCSAGAVGCAVVRRHLRHAGFDRLVGRHDDGLGLHRVALGHRARRLEPRRQRQQRRDQRQSRWSAMQDSTENPPHGCPSAQRRPGVILGQSKRGRPRARSAGARILRGPPRGPPQDEAREQGLMVRCPAQPGLEPRGPAIRTARAGYWTVTSMDELERLDALRQRPGEFGDRLLAIGGDQVRQRQKQGGVRQDVGVDPSPPAPRPRRR